MTAAPTMKPTPLEPAELSDDVVAQLPSTNRPQIPELAEHWRSLDFREILARPAAFISIGQSNSIYRPGGVQYAEGHACRGSLEATVRSATAARAAGNFDFAGVGYSLFRSQYPQNDFDRVQYSSWTDAIGATPEQIAWDDALVDDLSQLVQPGDRELHETALQTAFVGTDLPGVLARKKIDVVVFTGIHLDWCVEGNARAARDHGLLPIVIGDATGARSPEEERATFERLNNYFAPVLSSATFIDLLKR